MSAGYGPSYFHRNKATGITADNAQIIVDISDTTTYPHDASGGVALYALKFRVKGTAGSAGNATLQIGVVEENDATVGTFAIIAESDLIAYNEEYESGWIEFPDVIDLRIVSGALTQARAPVSGNHTILQNDAGDLVDAERATDKSAGAGDLIVLLDEGTNGGTYEYEAVAVWREL